jgi:hypothetical protein
VHVDAAGLTCDYGPETVFADGLGEFLGRLAQDWQGWDGSRTWDGRNGIAIEATHLGNRVKLDFSVGGEVVNAVGVPWQVRLPIYVSPGEALSRLAKASAEGFP